MQPIIKTKAHKIPKWTAEHIQLGSQLDGFTMATLEAMVKNGRARNVYEIHHSGKRFVQFERKATLKFKKTRNE